MPDPTAGLATQLRNIEQSTGRTIAQWAELIAASGLTRHGEIVSHLKQTHGLTHGNANALAHQVRQLQAGGPPPDAELLAAQYSGRKAALRPTCDAVVALAQTFGEDVEVAIKKTGVSLRRSKQFALIEAPSAKHVRLGLNLRGRPATGRLVDASGMCTHQVLLASPADVDDEVATWLRDAYERAG